MKFLLLSLAFALAGCGYRPLYGTERGTIHLLSIRNETDQENLAAYLKNALDRRLGSAGFELVGQAERTLVVRIVLAQSTPHNLTANRDRLFALDNEVRVICLYHLEDASGRPTTDERTVEASGLSRGSADNMLAENSAVKRRLAALADDIARRIAEELVLEDP